MTRTFRILQIAEIFFFVLLTFVLLADKISSLGAMIHPDTTLGGITALALLASAVVIFITIIVCLILVIAQYFRRQWQFNFQYKVLLLLGICIVATISYWLFPLLRK